ncbi:MAG: type II toxin-antitoxin system death-on-curing family toxin [Bacteroidales bacterium]
MITVSEVILIHDILIDKFGGTHGIRDSGLIESAISRPFQTFDKRELYPSIIQKAAALIESLVTNHPFIDGNKRIGYVIMRLYLLDKGYDIIANQDDKYDFVMKIAAGKVDFERICNWIENHIQNRTRH